MIRSRILTKNFCINTTIISINPNQRTLILQSGPYILNCDTNLNISDLKINDNIRVCLKIILPVCREAPVTMFEFRFLMICYNVKKDFLLTLQSYSKYTRLNSKISKLKIARKKLFPTMINRVGLIIMEGYPTCLNIFKAEFMLKCKGNLFIYEIKSDREVETGLIDGMNYFNKYHQIDLICVLTETLKLKHLLALSSKYVLVHMLKIMRKCNQPYTVSICHASTVDYITCRLTNMQSPSVSIGIHLIQQTQQKYLRQITNAINTGISDLNKFVQTYTAKLSHLQTLIEITYPESAKIDPVALIKNRTIKMLDDQLDHLNKIEFDMAQNICEILKNNQIINVIRAI